MATENEIEIFLSKLVRKGEPENLPSCEESKILRMQLIRYSIHNKKPLIDCYRITQYCQACNLDQSIEPLTPIVEGCEIKTIYQLFAMAVSTIVEQLKNQESYCHRCNQKNELFADFHHFEIDWKKDLVVRVFLQPRLCYKILWMDSNGCFTTVDLAEIPLFKKNKAELFYNSASANILALEIQEAKKITKAAIERFPLNRNSISLGYKFMNTEEIAFAEYIAECFTRQEPDNPSGYAFKSHVLIRLFESGKSPSDDTLASAEKACARALALSATNPEAQLAKCKILKLSGMDTDTVSDAYNKLLEQYPSYTDAIYDYAKHCLDFDPRQALRYFENGAKIDPQDPDFKTGILEALASIDRLDAAKLMLKQAADYLPLSGSNSAMVVPIEQALESFGSSQGINMDL